MAGWRSIANRTPSARSAGFRPLPLLGNAHVQTLLGTAVYTITIVLAAPFPRAAGMFLMFPALNGLAFFFSPPPAIAPMTASMLWMPVINGAHPWIKFGPLA